MQAAKSTPTVSKILSELEASSHRSLMLHTGNLEQHRRKFLPQIDKEQVKRLAKERYRKKWRGTNRTIVDSGFVSREFDRPSILKPKILNNWEMERIHMSRRSYDYPKDYKGMKTITVGGYFPPAKDTDLPQKVVDYIKKCEHDYIEAMYDPTETLKTYESKIENVKRNRHRNFKRTNTVQSNAFGYSRSAYRSISEKDFHS